MSMLKRYRPSSALQAIFSVSMERLMTVYKTLNELVQLHFYQKVFCTIVVPVPKFRMRKVTRVNQGIKEFVLNRNCRCIRIREGSIYYRENFDGFFAKNFSCIRVTTCTMTSFLYLNMIE